jgi:hypothetical protein
MALSRIVTGNAVVSFVRYNVIVLFVATVLQCSVTMMQRHIQPKGESHRDSPLTNKIPIAGISILQISVAPCRHHGQT